MLPTIDLHSDETPTGLPDACWSSDIELPELEDEEMIAKFESGLSLGWEF